MNTDKNTTNRVFLASCAFLIFWLSFFPEPIYGYSWRPVLTILILNLAYSIYLRKTRIKDLISGKKEFWLLLYLATVSGWLYLSTDLSVAADYYFKFIVPIPLLYYLFKNEFAFIKNKGRFFAAGFIFAPIVAVIGIYERVFGGNISYDRFFYNPFYDWFTRDARAISTQFTPVVLATYLAASLPIGYYYISKFKNLAARLAVLSGIILIFSGVIFSGTRGGFLAALAVCALYLFIKNKKMFVVFSLVLVLLGIFLSNPIYRSPLGRLKIPGMIGGAKGKIERYDGAVKIIAGHPVKGVGLASYKMFFDQYEKTSFGHYDKNVDNMYLTIAAETGIPAFLFFLLFVFYFFKDVFVSLKDHPGGREIILPLVLVVITILITVVSYDGLYWVSPLYIFWVSLGLVSSQIKENEKY